LNMYLYFTLYVVGVHLRMCFVMLYITVKYSYVVISDLVLCIVYCAATTAAVEGKMSKSLKKLLKKLVIGEAQEQLAVADAKLGNVIKVVL